MIKEFNESLHYVGVDDLEIDLFENQYPVPEGMAYNSYVLLDQKVAIFDTVDARKGYEWKANIQACLAGRKPDYLVVHHMEPDHSAMIAEMLHLYPSLTLVASDKAIKMLPQFFENIQLEGRTLTVKENDTLSLGEHVLQFFMAPMIHWPEVMMTYEQTEHILFSADGFGKFGAVSKAGYTSREEEDWACEARRYYFNICGKYGAAVQMLLKKVANLPIETICPLHGPVLIHNIHEFVAFYNTWSKYDVETPGVVVCYASIHGNTAKVAKYVEQQLKAKGCPKVVMFDLCRAHISDVIEDVFRYGRIVLAAASYDAGVFPPMHDLLHHMQIKACQNKRIAIIENGSWTPSAGRVMNEMVSQMKNMTIVQPQVTIFSALKEADKETLNQLVDAILA